MCSLLRPPALSRFMCVRLKSVASPQSLTAKHDLDLRKPSSPGFLTFEDPQAFKVKSFWELIRALGVFRLCSFPVLVNNCGMLMTFTRTVLGSRGFSVVIRPSVYAQFVAGETEGEIADSMQKMSSLGLHPMLAVPIEEDLGESTGEQRYEDNLAAMLDCVLMSHVNGWSKNPMMQLKITALVSPELCVRVSSHPSIKIDMIFLHIMDFNGNQRFKVQIRVSVQLKTKPVVHFDERVRSGESPTLITEQSKVKLTSLLKTEQYDLNLLVRAMEGEEVAFPGLTESENTHLLFSLQRLNKIGEASVNKVRVLVDAEYTYMNPALSLITMAMMKKFNQQSAWIWNTYQCYLKESKNLLLDAIQTSIDQSFCIGVKLVRGAYMDKERKLAQKEERTDPIHESWEHTNDSYNGCLEIMLNLISEKPERYMIIVATHNEESVRRAVTRMEELGLRRDGNSVCFGQLLGMCDHVSLTLAQHGFSVYKSVPYGSVDDTLPYLVRRAQENRTVLQGIRKERDLLRQELRRRFKEKITGAR